MIRGRFRLGPLPAGRHRVAAAAVDHLPAGRELVLRAGETARGFDLVLESGGLVLSGRVLDAGAGAIAGARVLAHLHGETTRPELVLAQTDRQGAYRLTLPRGFHLLVADADGYAQAWTRLWLVGGTARDFRLIPAAGIAGRVVEKGTDRPVAGARVRAAGYGPDEVESDAEGAFVFGGLEPGTYQLVARAGRLVGRLPVPVTVRLGARVEGVLIEMEAGRSVAGHVRRTGGQPVAGALVRGGGGETSTDGQGAYRLEGLLAGPQRVGATAPGFVPANRAIAVADQDLVGIDLELGQAAEVRGRVVDSQDRPVAGVAIYVEDDDEKGLRPKRSGDDGGFVLEDLPPGRLPCARKAVPAGGPGASWARSLRVSGARSCSS